MSGQAKTAKPVRQGDDEAWPAGPPAGAAVTELERARALLLRARSDRYGAGWELASYLAAQATEGGPAGEALVLAVLRAAGAADWKRIDESMRWSRYHLESAFPAAAEVVLRWPPRLRRLRRPTLALALVASMHRSGHVREAAVRWLAWQTDQVIIPALVLRTDDWVSAVREAAAAALDARLRVDRPEALLAAAPLILALAGRRRGGVWAERLGTLLRDPDAGPAGAVAVRALLGSDAATVRRFACGVALDSDLLGIDELVTMALRDLDQMVKLRCGERAVVKAPAAGRRDLLVRLLGARTAAVRYAALRALTTDGAGVELAERCLLDRSAFVRGLAQARLIDADIDPAGVYRQGLASPSAALPRALIGLAETAGRDAASLVAGYLADEREGIRKAAARAVVALDSGEATRLLEPMLADPAPGVVKVVVRLLAQRAGALDPDRLADRSRAPHPLHVRLGALRLRQALRGWQRLHADLEAAADPDPDLRAAGIADLGNWLRLAAPTTYTRPSLAERDQLLSLIDRVEPALPAGMARQLRFYVH